VSNLEKIAILALMMTMPSEGIFELFWSDQMAGRRAHGSAYATYVGQPRGPPG